MPGLPVVPAGLEGSPAHPRFEAGQDKDAARAGACVRIGARACAGQRQAFSPPPGVQSAVAPISTKRPVRPATFQPDGCLRNPCCMKESRTSTATRTGLPWRIGASSVRMTLDMQ